MQNLSLKPIIANKQTVLNTLKANRENHIKIVKEAKAGYIEKAKQLVRKELKKVGKMDENKLESISFHLSRPVDFTDRYDLAIEVLELHNGNTIELTVDQVRSLVMDKWDWTQTFALSNSAYSVGATRLMTEE